MEQRRLLAAPQVIAPPAPGSQPAWVQDGHFFFELWPQQLTLDFNQPVTAPDSALIVTNLTTGQDLVPLPGTGTDTQRVWQLSKLNEFGKRVPIPRGNFEAILNADLVANTAGEKLDGNRDGTGGDEYRTSFHYQPGDANHDRMVSADDYTAIDFNFAVPGATGHHNGDFNYDGFLSGGDYTVIDYWSGTVLPPPPTQANTLVAAAGRGFVDLTWVPPQGVADIDGYGLWRSLDGGATFAFHDFIPGDETVTTWTDFDLDDGTK